MTTKDLKVKRPIGRPPAGKEKKGIPITFKVSEDEYNLIIKEAAKNGLQKATYIRKIVIRSVKRSSKE